METGRKEKVGGERKERGGGKYRVLGEAVEEEEGGFREEWRRIFKKVR